MSSATSRLRIVPAHFPMHPGHPGLIPVGVPKRLSRKSDLIKNENPRRIGDTGSRFVANRAGHQGATGWACRRSHGKVADAEGTCPPSGTAEPTATGPIV